MADDKKKRGAADRARAARTQGYEVDYFAKKHGIRQDDASRLIKEIGNDRDKLDAAAEKLKKKRKS